MKPHRAATIWVILGAASLLFGGCQQTVRQARVAAPAPTPEPATVSMAVQSLPLPPEPRFQGGMVVDARPKIDVLVARVEASFAAGQKEYEAGDLDKARAHFNRALDLIMSSGFQVGFDPRLSRLFDQLGKAMETDEADAAKQDQEEKAETPDTPAQAAPMDEIAELTLPAGDPRLAARAERELATVPHDLPLTVNDSVLQYLSFFTTPRGRAIAERGLERAGRYQDMIRRVLKQEGVPQDLIYLAQAESAFQPTALSHAGARGIWQFMPFRGEEYDLERNYWIDERDDPAKATRAAADHLRDLYQMFGDWYLAMAAYNSGPLNVARAVQRTGYADFWDLKRLNALPKQTQNYVPIILALAMVAKDPALYGIQVDPEKPVKVDLVKPGHAIDLRLVSDATGVGLDDLRQLNPELLRTETPSDPDFALRLPAGTASRFEQNIQQVPEGKWTSWRLHETETGETLPEIAREYHVKLAALEDANRLEAHAELAPGFLLTIPAPPPRPKLVRYRVQRGDTLEGIAGRFEVSVSELKRWNHIRGSRVSRGARLRIYAGGEPASATRTRAEASAAPEVRTVSARSSSSTEASPVRHHVKRGETLYSIARQYGTTVSALRESNPFLADRSLEAGDVLKVQR
ncbi:MAG TPA: LysM peptidoglycan-binding domain-containing protein [Candidatus Acidoferrales bacterium]|nr:LysM peptidoglycan-binding domain-containing protein [Candidatus Acidoferrales bacterium]